MIRVGIAIPFEGNSWLGGLNYFRNLLLAVKAVPNKKIHPVLFVGKHAQRQLAKEFPDVEIVGTRLLDARHPYRLIRRAWQKSFGTDPFLEQFLKKQGIVVWSHSGFLGHRSSVTSIGWIPDFQHRHFPSLFSEREIIDRDRSLKGIYRHCDTILLSSEQARSDAYSFDPDCVTKLRVLPFVSDPIPYLNKSDLTSLERRYGFTGQYFHVPNHFWAHKNHRVIVDAISLLAAKGSSIQVLATGNTVDARQPEHFTQLMQYARRLGVSESFKSLGIVPYEDLVGLMRHACAIINPSLFEGWSTTVEEAKSLGKQIVLSSIPVHIEQSPERGTYFDPNNSKVLADGLLRILRHWDLVVEQAAEEKALAQLPDRQLRYGNSYQKIVLETIAGRDKRCTV